MTEAPVVELRGIVKAFPGVVANDGVDLSLRTGEVHALLGENGAGKTTLMSVLAGIYRPDAGEVRIDGREAHWRSPRQAIDAGIGMVHQHFRLVHPFTVAENVLLGADGGFRLARADVEAKVADLADRYGLPVKPSARIWQLSVGEQQRVEILKALYRESRVLILDEPTAVLTPQEAERLFRTLRQMAAEGRTVVFISHKLDEVMAVADRITALRRGKRMATVDRSETTKGELARLMVGRDVSFRIERSPHEVGDVRLRVEGLRVTGDLGLISVDDVSFEVRAGEILGIAGVAGNGQPELTEAIAGTRAIEVGRVEIGGRDVTGASTAERIKAGLAYVPEDRLGVGLIGSMDAVANTVLKRVGRFRRGVFLDRRAAEEQAERLIESYDVKMATLKGPVRLMSGGNVQKLLLARELSSEPQLLIAAHPTAGLDVGATQSVREILRSQRDSGTGVLLLSEDLDELFALSDRIAVIYEGRLMGIVDAEHADMHTVGLMMAGTADEATPK
jgi:general nucleoside transport system ATP-binding protein